LTTSQFPLRISVAPQCSTTPYWLRWGYLDARNARAAIGYGRDTRAAPAFWILDRVGELSANPGIGLHVSFEAPDRSSVAAFHARALRYGGKNAGAPGLRPQYTMPFYGAFVFDLDGFKIEAVCRAPE
jgi:hypothetical protein